MKRGKRIKLGKNTLNLTKKLKKFLTMKFNKNRRKHMICKACNFDDENELKPNSFQGLNLTVENEFLNDKVIDINYEQWDENFNIKKVYMRLYRCPKCGTVRAE